MVLDGRAALYAIQIRYSLSEKLTTGHPPCFPLLQLSWRELLSYTHAKHALRGFLRILFVRKMHLICIVRGNRAISGREMSENIIRRLERYFHEGDRVLDIGCNTGILLDYARTRGCVTAGVEPSLASCDILREKGHVAFSSTEGVVEKYDVVTAFDLVEHIYDFTGFFKKVGSLLVHGGTLLLLTGDNNSFSARISKKNWWYLKAPEHIIFPSRGFLNGIDGFELVSVDETYASLGYDRSLLLGLAQYIRKSLFLGGYDGLPSLGPDHMLVALRKVVSR